MSLLLSQPQQTIDEIVSFLQDTYQQQGIVNAAVAVSGGIDSALSLTLLAKAFAVGSIFPVFLPYADQSMADAQELARFNGIPEENWTMINIEPVVSAIEQPLDIDLTEKLRKGNNMARVRMIFVYDVARQKNALVCGTENKSEKYLGYFTRFGDEASDVEPIQHLYKTQIRQLAQHVDIPQQVLAKPPSAGLWQGQTDELELGFGYEIADQVLEQLIDEGRPMADITIDGVDAGTIQRVINRVRTNDFKHHVPYTLED